MDATKFILTTPDQLKTLVLESVAVAFQHHRPALSTSSVEAAEPISPEELCKRLDISKPTAWAWEKKKIIRGYHLGNRKYFIWQEVIADLTNKKGGVPA